MALAAEVIEDLTVYPVEERVGEDILQRWIIELLRPLVERWLESQEHSDFVGADQFIYFKQYDPHQRVAPDLYVLPGVAPHTEVRSWKTWEMGVVPSFVFEVASTDWEKDYVKAPTAHRVLGTEELIVFDPHYTRRREGARWQRFARQDGGELQLVERSDGDRIYSQTLNCFLRAVGFRGRVRVRLGVGPNGDELFPTAEEAERQAKEAERQAKETALSEVEALRRRIAELEAKKL